MLDENGVGHQRIKLRCPEESGIIERSNRTLREALGGEELGDLCQARDVVSRIVAGYYGERLRSALGYRRPIDHYRGAPATRHQAPEAKGWPRPATAKQT